MNFSKTLLTALAASTSLVFAAESIAIIQIHNTPSHSLEPLKESPNFIANEIAKMAMGEVITEASRELQLDPKMVRKTFTVDRIEETDFARIWVTHDDQEKAKTLANQLLQSYVSLRNREERDRAETQLQALDEELTLQGDLIQEHRKELTVLIQQYGVPYFDDDDSFQVGKSENQLYRQEQQRLQSLETEKQKHQARLHVLRNADPEKELFVAAVIDVPNNPVARLYQEYQSRPASKDHLDQFIENANRALPELTFRLETNLQIIEQEIALARTSTGDLQDVVIELSLKQHSYNQARNDYERSLAFYEELKKRQQEARHNLKMPKTPITIHERPE